MAPFISRLRNRGSLFPLCFLAEKTPGRDRSTLSAPNLLTAYHPTNDLRSYNFNKLHAVIQKASASSQQRDRAESKKAPRTRLAGERAPLAGLLSAFIWVVWQTIARGTHDLPADRDDTTPGARERDKINMSVLLSPLFRSLYRFFFVASS